MSERSPNIQASPRAIEAVLISLGFARSDDGMLTAPADSVVAFVPTGAFLELKIALADGTTVTAVLAKAVLKIRHAEAMERRDG
jgi:hypothetical protein